MEAFPLAFSGYLAEYFDRFSIIDYISKRHLDRGRGFFLSQDLLGLIEDFLVESHINALFGHTNVSPACKDII